jgi:hypothetical protein
MGSVNGGQQHNQAQSGQQRGPTSNAGTTPGTGSRNTMRRPSSMPSAGQGQRSVFDWRKAMLHLLTYQLQLSVSEAISLVPRSSYDAGWCLGEKGPWCQGAASVFGRDLPYVDIERQE